MESKTLLRKPSGAKLFKILLLFILVTAICLFLSLAVQTVNPESDRAPNMAKSLTFPSETSSKTKKSTTQPKEVERIQKSAEPAPMDAGPNSVLKPKLDGRQYKYVVLSNGMKVMLIHQKFASAACGVVIGAGAMSAPRGYEGLAHYTEHSIFSGSKNYVEPGYLVKFVERNDGYRNAFTSDMNTNYYMVIQPDMLDKGMHVFSDMFKTPLWNKDHIEREKISVQNELEKDRINMASKAYNVAKLIGDPKHPWSRFDFGAKSLFDEKDFMPEIKKFYKNYYTSSIMSLVVIGPQSINTLEALAKKHWVEGIQDHKVELPAFYGNPYGAGYISQEAWMANSGPDSYFDMHFPIHWTKKSMDKYDISMACNLISHLLTSSAPGTFIWKMKSLKYGFSARGSLSPVPRSFAMYSVTLYVSDKGLCERQKVVKLFFDYINTLKKSVSEKMWDNFFAEHKFKFQYREDTQTDKLAGSANNLLIKDPKWYLNSPEWAEKYNPGMIQMILGQIRGDNMNIVGLVGESILKETQPCVNTKFNRYDKHFLAKFSVTKFPAAWVALWMAPSSLATKKWFRIEPEEAFIPKDLSLLPNTSKMTTPEILIYEYGIRAFWKQASHFPKLHLTTAIYLGLEGKHAVLSADMKVFCALALHHVYKQTVAARRVGFTVRIRPDYNVLVVDINGYSDHALFYKFVKLVFDALLKVDRQSKREYLMVHSSVLTSLLIDEDESQKKASSKLGRNFFRDDWVEDGVLYNEVDHMVQEDILNFAQDVFHKVSLRSTVYGNIRRDEASSLLQLVKSYFQGDVITDHWVSFPDVLQLRKGRYVLQAKTHNKMEGNNMIRFVWQIGANEVTGTSLSNQIMCSIIQMLLHSEAYDELRSRQQIGYTVASEYYTEAGVDYFSFIVQGTRFSADEITKRTIEFLENYFRKVLVKFISQGSEEHPDPDQWWESIVEGAVGNLWGVDNYSKRMHSRWPYYNQYSYIKIVEDIVQKSDLISFYDDFILGGRTLILQYHAANAVYKNPTFKHDFVVKDLWKFRAHLQNLPLRYSW